MVQKTEAALPSVKLSVNEYFFGKTRFFVCEPIEGIKANEQVKKPVRKNARMAREVSLM